MLNNSFTMLGIALSNFEKEPNSKFDMYHIKVSVEKRLKGQKYEKVYTIKTFGKNTLIDFNGDYLNKVVLVNGYVDVRVNNGFSNYDLILQDIMPCVDNKALEGTIPDDHPW